MKYGGAVKRLKILGRPPRGGRGLKSVCLINCVKEVSRPPRGGRGLKCFGSLYRVELPESPPSRGAWIEIGLSLEGLPVLDVAPLAGGVD